MGDANAAVVRAFRSDYGRTVAVLMRLLGDLDAAEDAVQEAFTVAAETWPTQGVPPNPQAWVVTVARRRALDRLRRDSTAQRHQADLLAPPAADAGSASEVDDELRLVLLCAHPALSPQSQVALTLRFVGGLTAAEIARAFGVPEATMAQRLSRAKAKVRDASIRMRLPEPAIWRDRVDVALAVVYGIYNEGYVTTSGALTRHDLTTEAVRLARHLHGLARDDGETRGLLALLLLLHAREAARVASDGSLVPLPRQDRSLWNRALISEGQQLVRECLAAGDPGQYQIQAAIQAVHSDALTDADTDWRQIVALYDQLLGFVATPSVRAARAVAVGRLRGPEAGLAALMPEDSAEHPADSAPGQEDHYAMAVRASLLAELGRSAEAAEAFRRAAHLTENAAERELLLRRSKEPR